MNLQYSHFVTNTALTYDTAILLQILEGLINVHVLYYEAKQGYRGKSKWPATQTRSCTAKKKEPTDGCNM